ncbi:MAG: 50S ribosomal protein L21 [Candidatus Dormibacteria bacterium]
MYAVVRHGGHQYRVSPGDRLVVDRLHSEIGAVVGLAPVLLLSDADGVAVDAASLEGVRVAATVAAHRRGPKIRVFTFKPKKRHRRTLGFRAELTELVVDRFVASGEPLPEAVELERPPVAELPAVPRAAEEAVAEPEPPVRRRRRAAGSAPGAGDAVEAPAITEAPAEVSPPVEAEVATPRPVRRTRKPAAAAEGQAAEPQQPAPSSAAPATRKRRVGRTGGEPEAGE